jgi:hypothetical protein
MASLEDLKYTSIIDMSNDEAIDTLRQIRLSRRVPERTTKTITKKQKPVELDQSQAAELLKLLEGNK